MNDWAEFRHFLYLITILEKGGLRPAAECLHTSQPNLSVQARQFQEYASVCLYRKAKNGHIYPTETGLAFIPLAKSVLEARDEVIAAIVAIERGEIDTIRLGSSPLADQELFRLLCSMHKELLPSCTVRRSHGDTTQLAEALLDGELDAALVTLPLKHPDLCVRELRQDRLVVCMRRDSPLAEKAAIQVSDLQANLTILYHPNRHPEAHARLMELLHDAGLQMKEYSSASHPTEMQALVKEGYGVALMREGMPLDEELTTRRILGVDWTVDMAVAYHRERHPKTIPILVRKLRKITQPTSVLPRKPPQSATGNTESAIRSQSQTPMQLKLIR
jgi:DNA-binding transcriptional LysR family regulator